MNEANIEKSVICGVDWMTGQWKDMYKGYKETNDTIVSAVNQYPDRFIGFLAIDPRRGQEAINEIDRCVDLGLKGVKIWPWGFYPDDPSLYPFYEKVKDHNLPILYHGGSGGPESYFKYTKPEFIDTIAVDFREITFIIAHMGKPFVFEALAVARKNPNVYLDFSAWDDYYLSRPMHLVETIAKAKNFCGLDKILFGSDFPAACMAGLGEIARYRRGRSQSEEHLQQLDALTIKDWVDVVKNLRTPEILKQLDYPEITEEDKRMILGENAARILNQ
jgi:predicted TIM-barrel fold metal-dependent hydrolase